ncbi:Uncharacterised protein [Dorea longicatena]|uniref:Uncharacterized protein n=1 Tax=Dorea longicatena TaxID=88431 RepID=A0A564UUY1_9FIRM|nr:hypothetical protein [Dorea longicatena]VUX23366.1 Uncharacterised protein [Dorea longicatena]
MGALSIKRGTKMQLAKEAAVGQQPVFNMISTFNKELDESTFLVSIPRMENYGVCRQGQYQTEKPVL